MSEQNNSTTVLFILSVAVGVAMVGLGIIWPLLPVLATQMGAGGFVIGLLFAGFNVSRTLCSPFVGRFSDKMGRKNFIIVGLFIYALISFGYVWADDPMALIMVRVAHGAASLLVVPIALALAGDIAPKDKLGSYMGTLNMAIMGGLGVGPSLGGFILQHYGMDAAFHTMGLFAFGVAILVAIFLPSDKDSGAVARKEEPATLREILSNRIAVAVVLMRFFAASGQGAVYTFLPIYAMQIGMNAAQLGLILSVNIFLIALMQRPVGSLADRSNPIKIVLAGMFISSLSVLGMPFFDTFWPILALNILMGISSGFIFPGSLVITGYLGRTMGMASLMAVSDAAWSMGMIVSPILSGLIMDLWGIIRVFEVGAILILIGSVVVTILMRGYQPPADS